MQRRRGSRRRSGQIIGRKFVEVSEKPQVTRQRLRGTRALPTVILVGNARPTEMTATATKKNGAHTRMCGRRWRCGSGEKCSY